MPAPREISPRRTGGFILLLVMVVVPAVSKILLYDTLDPDCFWHLCVGKQLLVEGIHPLRDHLSFASMREPWTPYSWLAEIGMARLWAIGGYRAAAICASVCVAVFLIFIALSSREIIRGRDPDQTRYLASALSTAMAAILSLAYLSFRPVTLELSLLAVSAWLILRDRRKAETSRAVWLVAPIAVIGINIHLFAFLIPLWLAALWIGSLIEWRLDRSSAKRLWSMWRYGLLMVASTAACLCTPMLPGLLQTIGHYSLRDPMVASPIIAEMQPFWHGGMGKVSLVLVMVMLVGIVRNRRKIRAGDSIWLGASLVMLLRMGRAAPVFALIAAPLFAAAMPNLTDRLINTAALRATMAMVLILSAVRVVHDFEGTNLSAQSPASLDAWLNRSGPEAPGFPTGAVRFVGDHVNRRYGHLINEFNWGGYLAWRLGDRYQVLLDGRTQVYSPEFWKTTYLTGETRRREFFATCRADAAILPARKSQFQSSLESLYWTVAYQDDRAIVMLPPD